MHRLVVALVTLIGLTGAAFVAGYLLLFSASSDRAAALAPANSAFYVNIYLQPSTGQQMNLGGLIGRLPGFADESSLDEKVDQVVENLLGATGLELDYREDIKPWLGSQIALAGWPTDGDIAAPEAIFIVEVKDRALAEAALGDLATNAGFSFTGHTYQDVDIQVADSGAYAFVGDMLVVGETSAGVEAVVDVQDGDEALADREDFRATMARLPTDHLASAFLDLGALAQATGTAEQLSAFSTAGAALIAERDGIRLSGSAPFAIDEAASSSAAGFGLGGEPSSLVDWMPDDTIAELIIFGLRQTLEDAEEAAASAPEGEQITSALDTIRALASFGFGIDIDADVLPLLDREVGIALSGLDGGLPSGQILLRPEDPDAAEAALGRVVERLVEAGAATERTEDGPGAEITVLTIPQVGELAYAAGDGIIIIGLGVEDVSASLEAHADGQVLAANDRYVKTFEVAGARAGNEAFVDIGAIVDLVGPTLDLPDDARDILAQIGSFGFTAPSRDDQLEFHAVLTVDEP
ncbi:MAG: hypothetical protein QOI85_1048 [Chloroflexota bacterium]|nr:hypothetical protein [Chloroflexota bacterium]